PPLSTVYSLALDPDHAVNEPSIDRDRAPAFWSSMRTTTTATRCRFISNSKAPAISNPVEGVKGIVLGGRPDAVYMPGQLSLTPGDGIYVFTDGGTEANN